MARERKAATDDLSAVIEAALEEFPDFTSAELDAEIRERSQASEREILLAVLKVLMKRAAEAEKAGIQW